MTIFGDFFGTLTGGWKTYGPNQIVGPGAFDSGSDGGLDTRVSAECAMRLSAVRACTELRADTIGTLPLHVRDKDKKIVTDHPLYDVLHTKPNADMTSAEYWSLNSAWTDMFGDSFSIIDRRRDKSVIALTPVDPKSTIKVERNKSGSRKVWTFGQREVNDDDVLQLRGFSMCADHGMPILDVGRQILYAQLQANNSALLAFKQGLKVGGFFLNEGTKELTTEQLTQFAARLDFFGRPENTGKWMNLMRGMKPVAGTEFSVKPADAQLLESRGFGIEEICRLFNIPPPLIGHTSKTSSWASSLENLNLHYWLYAIQPRVIRYEQSMAVKLLSPEDRVKGIRPKFSMQGLLRGDMKTRQAYYASGLQNGYLSQNEVREFEDMPNIGPEGDVYRVQLNMAGSDNAASNDNGDKKPKGEEDQ